MAARQAFAAARFCVLFSHDYYHGLFHSNNFFISVYGSALWQRVGKKIKLKKVEHKHLVKKNKIGLKTGQAWKHREQQGYMTTFLQLLSPSLRIAVWFQKSAMIGPMKMIQIWFLIGEVWDIMPCIENFLLCPLYCFTDVFDQYMLEDEEKMTRRRQILVEDSIMVEIDKFSRKDSLASTTSTEEAASCYSHW